jgi:CheY-like chemotaxis protein
MKEAFLRGKNVLVAEDDSINQLIAKHLLTAMEATVDVASDGLEAIEKVKTNEYALVLMDIQMPEMNGMEVTEHIRKELKKDIPIIAMTASAMPGEDKKCLQSGMNAYLGKPFTLKKLADVIEKTMADIK